MREFFHSNEVKEDVEKDNNDNNDIQIYLLILSNFL